MRPSRDNLYETAHSSGVGLSEQHNLALLLLRLMLGLTMVWAGASKVFLWHDYTGVRAETLVRLGVVADRDLDWSGQAFSQRYFDWSAHMPKYLRNEPRAPVARARNVHQVTLIVHGASRPETASELLAFNRHNTDLALAAVATSNGADGWLPRFIAPLSPYLAWTVSLTQLVGGAGMFLGMGTRALGAGVCVAMLGAAWMTQIGPVALGGAPGFLGFLPPHEGWHPHGWKTLLWQMSLATCAASLALTGAGRWSLDRVRLRSGSARHSQLPFDQFEVRAPLLTRK